MHRKGPGDKAMFCSVYQGFFLAWTREGGGGPRMPTPLYINPLPSWWLFKTTDPQSEADIKLWKETWNELVPSMEAGIRLHLPELMDVVCPALEAQAWAIKAQGASAIATITEKMSKRRHKFVNSDC